MLTLITGTPGAGKTLYAVWELARKVPGSTVEDGQKAVPRRLLSNVRDLLVEHEQIGPEQLDTWHQWAQPGDVILFDEVQEVWRPRAMGTKVPPCIAALETHRHKGVDIILVTQHPMLVDPNIRRLVNQHLHLRRLAKTVAMVYEWDHCANPGQVKSALQSKVWFHPKAAYKLYKSAQLHTKPVTRAPRVLYVGLLALAGVGVLGPMAYGRITERFSASGSPSATSAPSAGHKGGHVQPLGDPLASASAPAQASAPALASVPVAPRFAGCAATASKCRCWDLAGALALIPEVQCREEVHRVGALAASSPTMSAPAAPVPSSQPVTDGAGQAAAPGRGAM